MTPEQDKFILANMDTVKKAANHWSRGEFRDRFDEYYSVGLLALCEKAAVDTSISDNDVYWHIRSSIWVFAKSRKNGRMSKAGSFPVSLDAMNDDIEGRADTVVHDAIVKFGLGSSGEAYETKRSHCKNGHEITPETTIPHKKQFKCRVCNLEGMKRYNARKREERLRAKTQN